jgi:hypothetical protein
VKDQDINEDYKTGQDTKENKKTKTKLRIMEDKIEQKTKLKTKQRQRGQVIRTEQRQGPQTARTRTEGLEALRTKAGVSSWQTRRISEAKELKLRNFKKISFIG